MILIIMFFTTNQHKLIIVCLLSLFFPFICVFSQADKQIDAKKLLKDLKNFEQIFEAHPDPYQHISEEDFKARLEEVKSSLTEPQTILEFYRKLAPILALIKDGHSAVSLPEFWLESKRKQLGAFPYKVYLTNENELYIIDNFGFGQIPIGGKIISINDLSVEDFIERIDPFVSYELKNFRNTIIDNDFEKYLYLAFGFSDKTSISYVVSDTTTVVVNNLEFKSWENFQNNNKEEGEDKIARGEPYAYKKISDGVGMLNIYAFYASDVQNYEIFLGETFRKIKRDSIHSLIIDIRGNFGGWPKIASSLFHYISDSYFKTLAQSSMKVSYPYRNYYTSRISALRGNKPYIPSRRHYIDLNALLRNELDTYVNEQAFFNEPPNTEKDEFRGDCYLLINRDSYSAASSFASTFQCYQMGMIIGEETGGTKIFRANPMQETLLRSGIRVRISTTKLYTTCYDQEFEGVQPNIDFTPSVLEITSGMDSQLMFTQRVIRKVQKTKNQ